jgi:hypothetical protein
MYIDGSGPDYCGLGSDFKLRALTFAGLKNLLNKSVLIWARS